MLVAVAILCLAAAVWLGWMLASSAVLRMSATATRPAATAPATMPAEAAALTEFQKVERVIEYVAGLKGAVFLRNGGEHTPAEAAEHMRTKWQRARDRAPTARDFIEQAASRSSLTGEAYRIRLSDGREVTARDLLTAELDRIEAKRPTVKREQ